VTDHFVPVLHGCDGDLPVELDRLNDCEDAALHSALAHDAQQAPRADSRAVFERGLDVGKAFAGNGRKRSVGEDAFRVSVAVENVVLAPGLVVESDLHRDARPTGPLRMCRVAAIADEVTRIIFRHVEPEWGPFLHSILRERAARFASPRCDFSNEYDTPKPVGQQGGSAGIRDGKNCSATNLGYVAAPR
jgi:hypothetical protein